MKKNTYYSKLFSFHYLYQQQKDLYLEIILLKKKILKNINEKKKIKNEKKN